MQGQARSDELNGSFRPGASFRQGDLRFDSFGQTQRVWALRMVFVFIVLMYANPTEFIPGAEALRPTQMAAVLGLGFLALELSASRQPLLLVWPQSHAIFGVLIISAASVSVAFWPRHAVEATLELSKFVIIYLLILNTVTTWQRLTRLLWAFVIGGIFPAVGALYFYSVGITMQGRAGWVGSLVNPNDTAFALVMLLPVAGALMVGASSRVRSFLVVVIGLYIAGIFVTFSRGGLLGLATVVGLMVLRARKPEIRLAIVVLCVLGLAILPAYWQRDDGFDNITDDLTLNQRIWTIQAGLAMFLDSPLIGTGINCSGIGWLRYAPLQAIADSGFNSSLHVHNTYVQTLAEIGGLGFLCLAIAVGGGVVACQRIRRRAERRGMDGLAARAGAVEMAMFGFMTCGLAGGYLVTWFPYLLVALSSCLTLVGEKVLETADDTTPEAPRGPGNLPTGDPLPDLA